MFRATKMSQNTSESFLTFTFTNVEEKPLMEGYKAGILTFFLLSILLIGVLIQTRIFIMLRKQGSDGSVIAIDRLFKAHNYINMTCLPALIIYLIFSHYLYPMEDYVGLPGCIFFSHFLNVFSVFYFLIFPLTIAIVRFVRLQVLILGMLY